VNSFTPVEYELPDGAMISIGKEQVLVAEPLFNPQILNVDQIGIPEMIHESIRKCELDVRKKLYNNIVLAGGSCLFDGMKERIENELSELVPPSLIPQIQSTNKDTKYSAWAGASIMSYLPTSHQHFVSREQYQENGAYHPRQ